MQPQIVVKTVDFKIYCSKTFKAQILGFQTLKYIDYEKQFSDFR